MVLRSFTSCLVLLAIAACGDSRSPQLELSGHTMGTTFKVAIVQAPESLDKRGLESRVVGSLIRIDKLASTWRDDSELSVFNNAPSEVWVNVTEEFCAALEDALDLGRETDGAFDVTIGPLVNLWGFGPNGLVSEPPSDDAIRAALSAVGHDKIDTNCDERLVRKQDANTYVDLSGWAKGHAVDKLAELLDDNGIDNYLVEIGGEMRVAGHNSEDLDWAVAIEAPSTSERVPQAVIRVTDTAIATSGDYRNYFEHDGRHYSHTIDPRTGYPATHNLAAVTVVHPSTAYADALATALLVLGPDAGPALAERLEIAAYFLLRSETDITEITTRAFDGLDA